MNTPTPETDECVHREMRTYMDAEGWQRAWRASTALARKLEQERDYARLQAEIERDKTCHRDHGGLPFAWETDERKP